MAAKDNYYTTENFSLKQFRGFMEGDAPYVIKGYKMEDNVLAMEDWCEHYHSPWMRNVKIRYKLIPHALLDLPDDGLGVLITQTKLLFSAN